MGKVLYSAVVLDEKSHLLLIEKFEDIIPNDWKKIAHHMTINLGKIKPEYERYLGFTINLRAVEFGISDKAMAVKVEGFPTINKIPHVTVAVNVKDGGKPVMSNQITDWRKLNDVIGENYVDLYGKVEEVKSNG